MPGPPDTHLLLRAFVDELVRCGVREACTSPGSRSSPLVLALVADGRLRCTSHVDERCAGFFATGLVQAGGAPVAITCTSGTAVANLLPAVVEAHHARLPLIVLTADRPPELREDGAGQAIDQIGIFGSAAKWFFEVGTHPATPERTAWMRTLACRAVRTATEGRPGPVHLNLPLREPLVPPAELPADPRPGRSGGAPWLASPAPAPAAPVDVPALRDARRGVIVAGRHGDPALGAEIARAAAEAGWPLLADPLGDARHGDAAIAHYDGLLRVERFAVAHTPDAVLRIGDLPTSKPLRAWLDTLPDDVPQIATHADWQDPSGRVHAVLAHPHVPALGPADDGWLGVWRTADDRAAAAIDAHLGDDALNEPLVARALGLHLPDGHTLFVAASMPIRDVETVLPARAGLRVLASRGANGIDGTVSAAFGAAAHGPTVLLTGDVALAHDIGGLLAARRLALPLVVVVVNNDGGGIFEFLPLAGTARAVFEEHVATPHGLDFAHAAALFGLVHARVRTLLELRLTLDELLADPRPAIVEVRSDRAENLGIHRALWPAIEAALHE